MAKRTSTDRSAGSGTKHWTFYAKCRDEDPELFFPEARGGKHAGAYNAQVEIAKAVCATCPLWVQAECLAFAMEHDAVGVWAGTTDDERKALRGVA